jgi:hypothetical protein
MCRSVLSDDKWKKDGRAGRALVTSGVSKHSSRSTIPLRSSERTICGRVSSMRGKMPDIDTTEANRCVAERRRWCNTASYQ